MYTVGRAEVSSLKKNPSFLCVVRLPDDGRKKQPKYAVAKYSEYIIFIVLCYSDPRSIVTPYLITSKLVKYLREKYTSYTKRSILIHNFCSTCLSLRY